MTYLAERVRVFARCPALAGASATRMVMRPIISVIVVFPIFVFRCSGAHVEGGSLIGESPPTGAHLQLVHRRVPPA
eukprot:2430626-Prymnesium_polylepis.1